MEEITTRFEIVRLAVKLGDFRTIDVQCDALRSLSLDEKLNEIIDLLESRNYRQALYEMKHYARSLEDDFFTSQAPQSSPSSRSATRSSAGSGEMGLFDLGVESPKPEPEREERVLDLDDILRYSRESQRPPVKEYVPAPTFELESEDATEKESEGPKVEEETQKREADLPTHETQTSSLTEATQAPLETPLKIEEEEAEAAMEREESFPPPSAEEETKEISEAAEIPAETTSVDEEASAGYATAPKSEKRGGEDQRYSPIPYVGQKFRNMIHQFPPVEEAERIPETVEAMQKQIASEGYTEEEIETFLRSYQQYKKEGKKGEAALVLLLAAATESQFAQFLLARELFKGEVIEEDHAEAFTQINTLADQNFPEAICDLAQFYEHGVGIGKDRQLALLLYEEAAEMGVARAARHYERLKNSRGIKSLFGKVKLPNLSLKLPGKDD
ncbi:tetratricopeptide repeat protein [Nitratifractor sp.]|uniref:tetratricopeptide repeat protein n=1 Tax=Nitratifractor sp. TaxID=2268144 RepID=UPI0025EB4651|nr:tetratricopeptide repeat protein [Nitratifractor sp.]